MPREMHHLHSNVVVDRKPTQVHLENSGELKKLEDESYTYSIHSYCLDN
jgi:hypothetical protein